MRKALNDGGSSVAADAGRSRWLATGGMIGALVMSSCCAVPVLLAVLGGSGAWVGRLSAPVPYEPLVGAATLACLAAGFRQVYLRPRFECVQCGDCAQSGPARITKMALWTAAFVALVAMMAP